MSRTLTVYLAADLKRFGPPLRDAQNDLNRFERAGSRLGSSLSGMLGPALIGATAAAGYLAVSLGVDGVKAAMDDEAAVAKLAKTMDNLGLSQDTEAAEAQIDVMQRQLGIADDLLRPSFEKLARAYGDTTSALDMLALATDIAAGTNRSLDQVTQALTRAAGGSATALAKIAPELDKNILKSGDMTAITKELSDTFSGQAKTASETFAGRISRLGIAFDEVRESFGAGFIEGLSSADGGLQDIQDTLKELEPAFNSLGKLIGNFVEGPLADAIVEMGNFARLLNEGDTAGFVFRLLVGKQAVEGWNTAVGNAQATMQGFNNDFASMGGGELDLPTDKATKSHLVYGQTLLQGKRITNDYTETVRTGTSATNSATEANNELTTAYELQRGVVDKLNVTLESQVTDLEAATAAAQAYSTTLATQLLGGVDLGAAQQTGTDLGISTLEAFDRQIAEAEWFGNVLSTIQATGADQRLVDQLAALGPEAGGKLAQEMIDKGLVQTFSDRLADVVTTANTTAQAMVPEFLTAGIDAAEGMVDSTIEQMGKETKRLKAIGKGMGDLIGATMKREIAQAVAEAVTAAEAAKTAAAAERAATIAAQQVTVSEQQIAQAVQRLITNSNARAGYSMGIPVQTPVLG